MEPIKKKKELFSTLNVPFMQKFELEDDEDFDLDDFFQEEEPKAPAADMVRENHPTSSENS